MTARTTSATDDLKADPTVPVATIYQNSDQVAGILQQLFGQPLIVEEARENSSTAGDEAQVSADASAEGSGGVRLPWAASVDVAASTNLGSSGSWTSTSGTAARQQFVYSQAYYLHLVRQRLRREPA